MPFLSSQYCVLYAIISHNERMLETSQKRLVQVGSRSVQGGDIRLYEVVMVSFEVMLSRYNMAAGLYIKDGWKNQAPMKPLQLHVYYE